MYRLLFRPILFRFDPERVHGITVQTMRLTGAVPLLWKIIHRQYDAYSQNRSVQVFGLKFPNPVGLAAGYDKDGLAWRGLTALGFGHIEVGTVTPKPQTGNPKPRVFRLPNERAIINRMGFPGRGADFVEMQLSSGRGKRGETIIGVNIGKNKDTPNDSAVDDYLYLLKRFTPFADYFAVNVSSPNTVGLRRLQARDYLEDLLKQLKVESSNQQVQRPILVKLAPDLSSEELDDALGAIIDTGMDGVIATNTTISRESLDSPIGKETGGLSGAPLTEKSRVMVTDIFHRTGGKLPIVGVGGIMTPDDAKSMLDAGASLVQVYTGLIYAGPGLVREIVLSL